MNRSLAATDARGVPPAGGLQVRLSRLLTRLVVRPWFWAFAIGIGLAIPIANQVLRPVAPPLPVMGTLPAFSFIDQQGRAFGSADLRGKVWLAGFIFTRCPTICPAITTKMQAIQKRARGLAPSFQLVSISVDPQHDTPEVLAAYAGRYRASPRMWHFLTGDLAAIRNTVEGGMKIVMGEIEGEQDFASLMHGTHFVLVDQQGQLRGYYDSSDADVGDRVLHDAAMLINRGE